MRVYRGFRPYCPDHLPVIGAGPAGARAAARLRPRGRGHRAGARHRAADRRVADRRRRRPCRSRRSDPAASREPLSGLTSQCLARTVHITVDGVVTVPAGRASAPPSSLQRASAAGGTTRRTGRAAGHLLRHRRVLRLPGHRRTSRTSGPAAARRRRPDGDVITTGEDGDAAMMTARHAGLDRSATSPSIGAGPAGMAAAVAAGAGRRAACCSSTPARRPGGQYWRHRDADGRARPRAGATFRRAAATGWPRHAARADRARPHHPCGRRPPMRTARAPTASTVTRCAGRAQRGWPSGQRRGARHRRLRPAGCRSPAGRCPA